MGTGSSEEVTILPCSTKCRIEAGIDDDVTTNECRLAADGPRQSRPLPIAAPPRLAALPIGQIVGEREQAGLARRPGPVLWLPAVEPGSCQVRRRRRCRRRRSSRTRRPGPKISSHCQARAVVGNDPRAELFGELAVPSDDRPSTTMISSGRASSRAARHRPMTSARFRAATMADTGSLRAFEPLDIRKDDPFRPRAHLRGANPQAELWESFIYDSAPASPVPNRREVPQRFGWHTSEGERARWKRAPKVVDGPRTSRSSDFG